MTRGTAGPEKRAATLGEVVRTFKAASARLVRQAGFVGFSWQRNYYEHVIRGDGDLNLVRMYIPANPLTWARDANHPAGPTSLSDERRRALADRYGLRDADLKVLTGYEGGT